MVSLLDDLVRPLEQRLRDRQAECFGGLEVDDQLELRGLLDREVGGFGTPEDLVHIDGAAPDELAVIRAVAHPCALQCLNMSFPVACWVFRRIGSRTPPGVIEVVAPPPQIVETYQLRDGDPVYRATRAPRSSFSMSFSVRSPTKPGCQRAATRPTLERPA